MFPAMRFPTLTSRNLKELLPPFGERGSQDIKITWSLFRIIGYVFFYALLFSVIGNLRDESFVLLRREFL